MIFVVLSLIIFIVILGFFAFPKFSPIPYFPSNKKDLPLIIAALGLKNDQTIIDLGAGDGIVIFEAAKESLKRNLDTRFIAVELNPILIVVLQIRRLLNPNRKNIKIIWGDMFDIRYSHQQVRHDNIVFYLYVSPWLLQKILKKLQKDFEKFTVVSYFYPLPVKTKPRIFEGKNKVFIYRLIANQFQTDFN